MFLCAGAVIHVVHSNDMKDMGGLRKIMPVTHISFLIACLAISGIPPFSGFFSKEDILLAAYHSNKLIYGIAVFTSGLTAFYMFRLYYSIFWSKDFHNHASSHGEGTLSMKIPLIILGCLYNFRRICSCFILYYFRRLPHLNHILIWPFLHSLFCWLLAGILLATYLYKLRTTDPG